MKDLIALLPMKANSERIKNKNLKSLCGQPLFFYIADTLRKINTIKKLVINTDSEEISNIAKERYSNWVQIHIRPINLRGDEVSMNKIINYDVNKLGLNNIYLQTHSTNPLLREETLNSAIKKFSKYFLNNENSSLFSANLLKSRLYDDKLLPINHDPSNLMRTQDLKSIFEENSCFYIFYGATFVKNYHRISKNPYVFPMARNSVESIDIDDKEDWLLAQQIISSLTN